MAVAFLVDLSGCGCGSGCVLLAFGFRLPATFFTLRLLIHVVNVD
ncbi:hypothetical protein ACFVXG_00100 [Kitasatospora sp. NPDC058162]